MIQRDEAGMASRQEVEKALKKVSVSVVPVDHPRDPVITRRLTG